MKRSASAATFSSAGLRHTAAWRISLWSTLAFAIGTAIVFFFLQQFVSEELQRRSDAWLSGEVDVMTDVAQRTPADKLHDLVMEEVAELASKELPKEAGSTTEGTPIFFTEFSGDGQMKILAGNQTSDAELVALRGAHLELDKPTSLWVPGFHDPFRVVAKLLPTGDRVYIGLSETDRLRVLSRLRAEFVLLWVSIALLGAMIVFVSTRRMLGRVEAMSQSASQIGSEDLNRRLPTTGSRDEISNLAVTLNRMLDRIENSVQELHTITDSLAHDLRSPMTAIRGKLELALSEEVGPKRDESVVSAIEELDRLSDLLTRSLDVSEANAESLRLRKQPLDLDATVRAMVELYEPALTHAGITMEIDSAGPLMMEADHSLVQRLLANLFDNELKHLRAGGHIAVHLRSHGDTVRLRLEDDGPGFPHEVQRRMFQRFAKGPGSQGHGLGLAFIAAVARSHGGDVRGQNRPGGGIVLELEFPALVGVAAV